MRNTIDWMLAVPAVGLALPVLIDSALKGVILMALILAAVIMLRRSSAALRHLVLAMAMAGLFALPVLSVTLPGWRVLPAWAQTGPVERPASTTTDSTGAVFGSDYATAPAAGIIELPQARDSVAPAASPGKAWIAVAVWLWVAGGVVLGLRLALSRCLLFKLGRDARRCDDAALQATLDDLRSAMQVRRKVDLLLHRDRSMPMTWGIFKTRLLLPEEATSWQDGRLRAVLLHELAHVRRRDCLTQLLVQTVCTIHWFNPLVWVAARRLAAERERACDDLVLVSGVRASDYAEHLLRIATGYEDRSATAAAALAMARKSRLEGRLTSILNQRTNRRHLTRRVALAVAAALALLALPVAMMRAVADEPEVAQPEEDRSIEELAAEWAEKILKREDSTGRRVLIDPDSGDILGVLPDEADLSDSFFGSEPADNPRRALAEAIDSISMHQFTPRPGVAPLDDADNPLTIARRFFGGAETVRSFKFTPKITGADIPTVPNRGPVSPSKASQPDGRIQLYGERLGGKAFVDGYNHVDPAKSRPAPGGLDPLLLSDRSGIGSEVPEWIESEKAATEIGQLKIEFPKDLKIQLQPAEPGGPGTIDEPWKNFVEDKQFGALLIELHDLKVEKTKMAELYGPKHPKMVALDAKIRLIESSIENRDGNRPDGKQLRLEIERKRLDELLAAGLGKIHPRVLQQKDRIEVLEKQIATQQAAPPELPVGIGIMFHKNEGGFQVMDLLEGGPADRGGLLKRGDIIVAAAEGTAKDAEFAPFADLEMEDIVARLRGEAGETVRLRIERKGEADEIEKHEIAIVREQLKLAKPPGVAAAKPEAPILVKLRQIKAAEAKKAIDGVIGKSTRGRVVVDERTNSLIYIGDPETLMLVRSMVEYLDK